MNPEHIIEQALAKFDAVPTDKFTDPDWWENIMLPALGLNDENPHEMPPELTHHAGGLRIWQYPNQFGPYIATIAENAHLIDTYIEIGCRHGGTFIVHCEILRRLNPRFKYAIAVDLIEPSPLMIGYTSINNDTEYWRIDTASPTFNEWLRPHRFGLAFIDGDHTYQGVNRDWETIRDKADMIVFHDICSDVCPGVAQLWHEIPKHEAMEFRAQYDTVPGNYMGIGLVR